MALIWSAILADRLGSTFLAIWHSPSFQPRPITAATCSMRLSIDCKVRSSAAVAFGCSAAPPKNIGLGGGFLDAAACGSDLIKVLELARGDLANESGVEPGRGARFLSIMDASYARARARGGSVNLKPRNNIG